MEEISLGIVVLTYIAGIAVLIEVLAGHDK